MDTIQKYEIIVAQIVADLMAITKNNFRDVLGWHVGVFKNFTFIDYTVADHSLFLMYKFDNNNDCLLAFKMLNAKLNFLSNLNTHEEQIKSGKCQYIIFWHVRGIDAQANI